MKRLFISMVIATLVIAVGIICVYRIFSEQPKSISRILKGPFKQEKGHCWTVHLPEFSRWSDNESQPENSTLLVYEDGRPLGSPHSLHDNIRKMGRGKFSHWGETLFFSTSDNSDPNTNGRHYSITASPLSLYLYVTRYLILIILGLVLSGGVAGLLLISAWGHSLTIKNWVIALAVLNLGIIFFLYFNVISPLLWYGKTIYFLLFLFCLMAFASLFLICHECQSKKGLSGGKKIAFRIVALWSIVGTFVVLLEVFFRIIPIYDTLALNPGVKFFWPDYVYYPLNAMGYRDRPFSPEKGPHTYRIMVVGDSFTEGNGCRREETFAGVLERELNQRFQRADCPNRVEVYNVGRSGANTVEEVHRIVSEGPILKPDLIILAYVLNDPENHPPDIKFFDPPPWASAIHKVFLDEVRSYAYYWFFTRFTLFRGTVASSDDYCMAVHDDNYQGFQKAKKALVQLKNYLKKNNIDFMVIIFPQFKQGEYPLKLKELHEQVFQMMQVYNFEAVDLLKFFEKINKNLGVVAFSVYDQHPNSLAHKLVGDFLAESIGKRESFVRAWENCGPEVVSR